MNKRNRVIVAGHVCLDITPIFSSQKPGKLEQILVPGKLIHMEEADVHTGGCVSNTGLAMRLLGVDVTLMGKVGKDNFGQALTNIFKEHGVEDGLIIDEASTTSYSIVIAPPGVDRMFLHHPGANDTFSSDDIKDELLDDVVLFHFGYPPLMRQMYINDGEELIKLYKRLKSKGIVTSLDMAAVDSNSEAGRQDWKKILNRLMPYVDIFAPSAEELCYMLDSEKFGEWSKRAAGRDLTEILRINEDIDPLGRQLIDMGAKIVIIKCGSPGLYYRTAPENDIASIGKGFISNPSNWGDRSGFEKSYKPDRVMSATGAGDTTIAAFLASIINDYPLDKCLQMATATGASNVTEYDALSGLMTFPELEKKILEGWPKAW
jgi:sugar/nucleoside kinase (ribokinase family)